MELKKSEKADLEKNKRLFTELGLAFVLLVCYGLFQVTVTDTADAAKTDAVIAQAETEMAEITREPEPPKPELQEKPEIPEPETGEIEETDDASKDESDKVQNEGDQKTPPPPPPPAPIPEDEGPVHMRVEKMPSFPGGDAALLKFIGNNLVYPQDAIDMGWSGTTIIKFVVGRDGKARNPEILKSSGYPLLDKEAMAIVAKLPQFTPGEQAGEKVPVYYMLPVQFQIAK
jgi:protein TonB